MLMRLLPARSFTLVCLLSFMSGGKVYASLPPSLADFSLEELSDLVVTTVSRREELLHKAPAAVYVISAADIRRSGANSLPEALRLAPNLQVAQIDASRYAVTARGGNALTANNLLVLIDGRIIYTPLYSGVFWDAQDLMLEDVERIEVISGPGATIWGANAVNGVINILTRSTRDTQGTLIALETGQREHSMAVRQGGTLGDDGYYRIYGKTFQRANTKQENGAAAPDDGRNGQVGFRTDWGGLQQRFTLQGDVYRGRNEVANGKRDIAGAHLLARWHQERQEGSHLTLLGYYDRAERVQPTFAEDLDTINVEFQHGLPTQGSHKILWGAGHRYSRDHITNSSAQAFLPAKRSLNYSHLFLQDQLTLSPLLDMTAGLKLETNPYTGLEYLPNLRLAYKPADKGLWWTSLSRAVRTPARLDRDLYVPGIPPYTVVAGGSNFKSEVANVVEVGYRGEPFQAWSYSVTVFHHRYDRLRSIEPGPDGPVMSNLIEGLTTGFELWGSYRVSERWSLTGGWTEMTIRRTRKPGSQDTLGLRVLGNDPDRTVQLRSSASIGAHHTLDMTLRHVSSLPNPQVPAYTVLDVRVGWQPASDIEWSLQVRNLLDDRHVEWGQLPLALNSDAVSC